MMAQILEIVFGFRRPRFLLNTEPLPIGDGPAVSLLSLSLVGPDGAPWAQSVAAGDEVSAGRFLASDGHREVRVSPVAGKVVGISPAADVRGAMAGRAIIIEPDPDSKPTAFSPLDPDNTPADKLWERINQAGIITSSHNPRPLAEVIGDRAGVKVETVVVLAADREPLQCSMLQLFRERSEDSCKASLLLKSLSGADKVLLAAPKSVAAEARKVCERHKLAVLELSDYYPDSLEPMVNLKAGGGEGVRVVAVETALAALDAVREGRVQDKKVVTVIGPGNEILGNYRVSIGTRTKDLLAAVGIKPGEADKVIVGGPMRGHTQYALDGAIDAGVDAITVIHADDVVPWSGEPCINCGACTSVCPTKLQVQLLGRYGEFGLFERTEELGIENCIECGLCAAVCTSRRPLVQWLRLSKREVEAKKAAQKAAETAKCEVQEESPAEEAAASVE